MRPLHPRALPAALAALLLVLVAAPPGAAQVQRGALVRIPYQNDVGTLTPYSFTNAYPLMTLVYDTLLWRDREGVPRPWLARSVTVSADGRRLTVRLAPGARWHDGVALTAADVAFTFDYVRRNHNPRFTPQLRELAGVTVTGRDSLVIRLRRPSPGFLDQPLADVPILPRHIWARLRRGVMPRGLPVGSGPYRLVRHRPERDYRFEAVPGYFRGQPGVRRIEVVVRVASERDLAEAFDRDDVDLLRVLFIIGSPALFEAQGIEFLRGSGYLGTLLTFNLRRPPFDSARLRRAVAQALELPRIARAVAGPGVPIEPAQRGLLHPRSRWATAETLHEPNVAAARAALKGLGGRTLRVLVARNDEVAVRTGREVVSALRRAGARATLAARSGRAYQDALGMDGARPDFALAVAVSGTLASYDPDNLRELFGAGGELNYSGYRSAGFERLADRVTTTRAVGERRAAVAAQLRLLARDAPVVPLFFDAPIFAFRRAAWDGWTYVAGAGVIDKLSFMERRAARVAGSAPATAARPAAEADDGAMGVLGYVALALFGLAGVIVAVGSLRRRR